MDTMTDHWGGTPPPAQPAIDDEQRAAADDSEPGASDPGECEEDPMAMAMLQASRACLEAQREAVLILGIINPSFTQEMIISNFRVKTYIIMVEIYCKG